MLTCPSSVVFKWHALDFALVAGKNGEVSLELLHKLDACTTAVLHVDVRHNVKVPLSKSGPTFLCQQETNGELIEEGPRLLEPNGWHLKRKEVEWCTNGKWEEDVPMSGCCKKDLVRIEPCTCLIRHSAHVRRVDRYTWWTGGNELDEVVLVSRTPSLLAPERISPRN